MQRIRVARVTALPLFISKNPVSLLTAVFIQTAPLTYIFYLSGGICTLLKYILVAFGILLILYYYLQLNNRV
jgi:hypothetical protein